MPSGYGRTLSSALPRPTHDNLISKEMSERCNITGYESEEVGETSTLDEVIAQVTHDSSEAVNVVGVCN